MTAAVVGVILNLAVWFALHALFAEVSVWRGFGLQIPIPAISSIDYSAVAIASAAIIALLKFKAPMIPTLAMCAAAGLIVRLV